MYTIGGPEPVLRWHLMRGKYHGDMSQAVEPRKQLVVDGAERRVRMVPAELPLTPGPD